MANNLDNHMIFRVVLIVLAAVVLFALINYYNSKQKASQTEKFYEEAVAQQMKAQSGPQQVLGSKPIASTPAMANEPSTARPSKNSLLIDDAAGSKEKVDGIAPSDPLGDSDFRAVDFSTNKLPSDCFPKDRLTSEDLLPKDAANSKWAQVNPAGQGDVSNQNFLTAGWSIGINTISGTLRNANLQLRSEPPNPRGAWPINNSTIQPDLLRRPLEIGGDC